MATFTGTDANETITPGLVSPTVTTAGGSAPGAAGDILNGGGGNDTLAGGGGDDQMFGEAGDDRMIWNNGDGTDLMEGGDGADTAEVNGGSGGETFTITANGARVRFDRLNPTPFSLDIGTTERLVLNAGGGNDTVSATGNLAALIQITVDGGAGNDIILGSNGADFLLGGDGDDFVDGQQGNDTAFMGVGDDVFQWDPGDGSDVVEGQAGFDRLLFNGSGGNETINIFANGGRATVFRDLGSIFMDLDDVERLDLNAAGGADTITVNDLSGTDVTQVVVNLAGVIGGTAGDAQTDTVAVNGTVGADTVVVSGGLANVYVSGLSAKVSITTLEAADIVRINALAGNDTVDASAVLHAVVANGDAGNDILTGGGGFDTLLGGEDNDTLSGGIGDDLMFGEAGDDRMIWNSGDSTDLMEGGDAVDTAEANGGSGAEEFTITANGTRVRFDRLNPAPSALDIGTTENLVLNAGGGDDRVSMTGNLAALIKITVDGGAGNDIILGSNGADLLLGGDGNDFVDGQQGNDVALLGAGDDVFQWDPGDGSDLVEGQSGFDALLFNGSNINEIINISANGGRVLFFRDVANIVMDLNDVERLEHNAFGGADAINVNDLTGTDVTQVVVNLAGEIGGTAGDGQMDLVTVSGTNGADAVKVTGGSSGATISGLAAAVTITTLELADAVTINALGGNDTVDASAALHAVMVNGGAGNDTVKGSAGADVLTGGDANDVLTGGLGNDQMFGDAGDDRMIWNPDDGTDLVEGGDGTDIAEVNGGGGAEIFDVAANGGRVLLQRTAPLPFFLDIGSTETLALNTGGGDDSITMAGGLAGLIKISVNAGAGADTIIASDGNDVLEGGSGVDHMEGGAGDDLYFVDTAADVVVELAGNGLADRVAARASYVLAAGADIELLTTTLSTGTAALNLTGNALKQEITGNAGSNVLHDGGAGAADTLRGLGGNDTYRIFNSGDVIVESASQGASDRVVAAVDYVLGAGVHVEVMTTNGSGGTSAIDLTGNALKQDITGNAGSNILHDGGAGAADILRGLEGNDTYRIFNSGDIVIEAASQGTADKVVAAVDYKLGVDARIETMITNGSTGTSGIDLTGNGFAQAITGNAGVNILDGKGGNDVLRGFGGKDFFVFSSTLGAGNVDTVSDFSAADDTVRLENAIFTALVTTGTLSAAAFRANATGLAGDASDRIIYETDTGRLFYDFNGNTAGGGVHFATLTGAPAITNGDFVVI